MEVNIKEALDQILTENANLKQHNEEMTQKLGAIAKTLNGSFIAAQGEPLVNGSFISGQGEPLTKGIIQPEPQIDVERRLGQRLDDATRRLIVSAYKKGEPVADLVRQFKVSSFTVYNVLQKMGVARRQGRARG